MVNSNDLIKLLMRHPKMQGLRDEAGTAFVQRETGAVGGIARSVQAATAPTEGQRMLQDGYQGVIANGESREQTTSTIGPNGQVSHEHLAERSAVLPDGQGVLVQQAAVVQAPLVTMAEFQSMVLKQNEGLGKCIENQNGMMANMNNSIMGCVVKLQHMQAERCDTAIAKEAEATRKMMTDRDTAIAKEAVCGEVATYANIGPYRCRLQARRAR